MLPIDFTCGKIRYRQEHLHGRNELIAKAIGWKKNLSLRVFDTTAGLGREAFLLAALGCEVVLFERHAVVAKALRNGLAHAKNEPALTPIINRMTLLETCAIAYLKNASFQAPDIIYCDPMFPPRSKSAAVKKEMQLLQSLVSPDVDTTELVTAARAVAQKRVVVKRAARCAPLVANPDLTYRGRSHCFDVYCRVIS